MRRSRLCSVMAPSGEGEPPVVSKAGDTDGLRNGADGLVREVNPDLPAVERHLWTVALGLLVLDLATTAYGLKVGFQESNPIAVALLSDYGFWALVVLKGVSVAVAIVGWGILPAAYRYVAPLLLAGPWLVGTVLNVTLVAGLTGP